MANPVVDRIQFKIEDSTPFSNFLFDDVNIIDKDNRSGKLSILILKEINEFMNLNNKIPSHLILHTSDFTFIKYESYKNRFNKRIFNSFKDMIAVSSNDVREGEIVCL